MNSMSDAIFNATETLKSVEQAGIIRTIKKPNVGNFDDVSTIPEEPHPESGATSNATDKKQAKFVSSALAKLESLIVDDDSIKANKNCTDESKEATDEPKKRSLPKLDNLSRTVVTSYSLQAYIKLLPRNRSQVLVDYVYNTANEVFRSLFRFQDAHCLFHSDHVEIFNSVVRLSRKEMCDVTKNHMEDVIYLSPGLPYETLPEHLKFENGVKYVEWISSMNTPFGNVDSRLDVGAFEQQLDDDVASGKKPMLVIAVVGSFFFGHNDLVSKLLELRERHKFRLHLVGLNLAALISAEPQSHLFKIIQSADSFSVPLSLWLGVQGLPHITMFKRTHLKKIQDGGETDQTCENETEHLSFKQRLDSVPWWVVTEDLGLEAMKKRVDDAYAMSCAVLKMLSKYPRIEFVGLGATVSDILNRIDKKSITAPSVLTFKYSPFSSTVNSHDMAKIGKSAMEFDANCSYMDCLNIWLAQGLAHECSWLSLQLVDLSPDKLGTAVRYCALESAAHKATIDKIPSLRRHLESMLTILDVTVSARRRLSGILSDKPQLLAVDVPRWAGVAGLVYVPAMMRRSAEFDPADLSADKDQNSRCWTEKQKHQVSLLNVELVHALRNMDSAFSLGETEDGVKCVKFGMLADEHDLLELIDLVADKGKEIEESSQYMDSLAEIVRQGIEAANEDLKKETESRLVNEGVLRQVPLVGSVLNWWSPLPKDQLNVKGRAFNLVTGRVLPTDTVFMHKPINRSAVHTNGTQGIQFTGISDSPQAEAQTTNSPAV